MLMVIEEVGKDIRLSYAGNRLATHRITNGIGAARKLVGECLAETEYNARQ